MCRYSFLLRIHWRLLSLWLLCIFIYYLLIEWWFRCCFFLLRIFMALYLLFFSLIRPSYQKALNLMIVLFVSKDFSHDLILVAIWDFILTVLTSTDSWIWTLSRFSAIHESTILLVWWLRLNWRLIIFSVASSRHLINDTEAFLSELWVVLGRSTGSSSWCLWLLLPLSIIIGGTWWQSGLFEIASQQNRLIFPCLIT